LIADYGLLIENPRFLSSTFESTIINYESTISVTLALSVASKNVRFL